MSAPTNRDLSGVTRQASSPYIDSAYLHSSRPGSGITTFAAQLLRTSIDMTVNDGSGGVCTAVWTTDEAEGYARLTYNSASTFGLQWTFINRAVSQCYVKFSLRRSNNNHSKFMKVLGQGIPTAYSNCTMNLGYTGTELQLSYGDSATISNDSQIGYSMDGTVAGGSTFERTAPTLSYAPEKVYYDITGTVWADYEFFVKFNTDGVADGEFAIWKNGTLIFHATNVYNCRNTTQYRDIIGLGEYSNASGFYEDYKKFDVSYERPVGRGI